MKRRFLKSENNYMNRSIKRLGALCASGLMLVSTTACGLLEMRDATSEINVHEETIPPVLSQAERHSEIEKLEEATTETETTEIHASQEVRIRFAAGGGIVNDGNINADAASRAAEGKDFSFLTMYTGIYPLIHNADVSLTTLGVTCAEQNTYPVVGSDVKNMPPESLTALADLGFDVINAAGRNLMAFGDNGAYETVQNVCDSGVLQIGAYYDAMDANDIRIYEHNDVRIAFLAFMEETYDNSSLVIPSLQEKESVQNSVAYADLISDVVITSVTWNEIDSGNRQNYARTMAEAGADIIIGYDSNALQSAEWLTKEDGTQTLVVYSLGNMISSGNTWEQLLSGILTVDIVIKDNGIVLENTAITPVITHYTNAYSYQVMTLDSYTDDMAAGHKVENLSKDLFQKNAAVIIPTEFQP